MIQGQATGGEGGASQGPLAKGDRERHDSSPSKNLFLKAFCVFLSRLVSAHR